MNEHQLQAIRHRCAVSFVALVILLAIVVG